MFGDILCAEEAAGGASKSLASNPIQAAADGGKARGKSL